MNGEKNLRAYLIGSQRFKCSVGRTCLLQLNRLTISTHFAKDGFSGVLMYGDVHLAL